MDTHDTIPAGKQRFPTTQWTLVRTASGPGSDAEALAALERLCKAYWYPLYVYVRRRGTQPHDAQDLTQEFFRRLLDKHTIAKARAERGKFRTFLLCAMQRFLVDEWKHAHAQKRTVAALVWLDGEAAESRYAVEIADRASPEKLFERQWAIQLLDQTMRAVQSECHAAGKQTLFSSLRGCLVGESDSLPYADHARHLGMTEGAVKVAVHRLRHRFRALLRAGIAETVADHTEIEDELQYLFRVLSS